MIIFLGIYNKRKKMFSRYLKLVFIPIL